ncbi:MAG TPA: hypothetical protein VMZ50_04875, partial [Phycisphaerae bacterium]|nr:hypothetical protein [Phycisphaerae bacterium]
IIKQHLRYLARRNAICMDQYCLGYSRMGAVFMNLKMILFAVVIAIVLMVATYAIAVGVTGGIYMIREC